MKWDGAALIKAGKETGNAAALETRGFSVKKLAFTGMLGCLSFVLCTFVYFPHMAPFQHMCNLIGAVFLGPWYNLLAAFLAGGMRIVLTGRTFQAVIGAIFGAWLSGFLYRHTHKLWAAWVGEVIGTGLISAVTASVIFNVFLNVKYALTYLIPFYAPASAVGGALGVVIIITLKQSGVLSRMIWQLNH